MDHKRDYLRLMGKIVEAHRAFSESWSEARTTALKSEAGDERAASWEQVWQANGVAYKAAQPIADRRDRLLGELFEEHLIPLDERFQRGEADAVSAVIDFLEVDVPAFRCGYAKESYLRSLKRVPLADEHRERLRKYGLRLCQTPAHRREIREAGRLMIQVADQGFIDLLRGLSTDPDPWIRSKTAKMLAVVLNGRRDLR